MRIVFFLLMPLKECDAGIMNLEIISAFQNHLQSSNNSSIFYKIFIFFNLTNECNECFQLTYLFVKKKKKKKKTDVIQSKKCNKIFSHHMSVCTRNTFLKVIKYQIEY